jgi:hypothetical protein
VRAIIVNISLLQTTLLFESNHNEHHLPKGRKKAAWSSWFVGRIALCVPVFWLFVSRKYV